MTAQKTPPKRRVKVLMNGGGIDVSPEDQDRVIDIMKKISGGHITGGVIEVKSEWNKHIQQGFAFVNLTLISGIHIYYE